MPSNPSLIQTDPLSAEADPTNMPTEQPVGNDHGAEREKETSPVRQVPVTESIRYRRRAQAAEARIEDLEKQLKMTSEQYRGAHQALEELERKNRIDQMLVASNAIDLESTRLLTEVAIAQMDEPDIEEAVETIREKKPFLFHHQTPASGGSMSPRHSGSPNTSLLQAAEAASLSGNRNDLLSYLRMRRSE